MVKFGNTETFIKNNCKRNKITDDDGKPLILTIRDCFSWGIRKDKFGNETYRISLVVTGREKFLNQLQEIKTACQAHAGVTDNILKSLYHGQDGSITLYCNLSDGVRLRKESDRGKGLSVDECPKGKVYVHAAVAVESISMTNMGTNLKVIVKEIMFLNKKVYDDDEWEDIF